MRQNRLESRTSCNSFSPDFHVSGTFERHVTRYDWPIYRAIDRLRAGESYRVAAPLHMLAVFCESLYNHRCHLLTFVADATCVAEFNSSCRRVSAVVLAAWSVQVAECVHMKRNAVNVLLHRRGVTRWDAVAATRRRRCMKPRCSVIVPCNPCVAATWRHMKHVAATLHQIGMVLFLMQRRLVALVWTNQEQACYISCFARAL